MTTTPHEIRNWLHQLLSSIEAAMPDVTAQCFSQHRPLTIITPYPNTDFTEWQPLADAFDAHLEGLRPGAIRYRLIENVTLAGDTLPAEMPLPLQIQWQVVFFRRGETPGDPLLCTATLIREDNELVATYLSAVPPSPPPATDDVPSSEENEPTEVAESPEPNEEPPLASIVMESPLATEESPAVSDPAPTPDQNE
jgi:hypothetical protein